MSAANVYVDRRAPSTGSASGLPIRGAVIGAIALGLGLAAMALTPGGTIASGDVALLAGLGVASVVGARESRRILLRREQAESGVEAGQWMTITISPGGPADTAGVIAPPKAPPRNDPERRSLARRARERRREGASPRR